MPATKLDAEFDGLGRYRKFKSLLQIFRQGPLHPTIEKLPEPWLITPAINGALIRASGGGPSARNVFNALVRSRSPDGFRSTPKRPCVLQKNQAQARGPAPIQTTNLPGLLRTFGEQPHNLGTLPITRKNQCRLPNWMRSSMALAVTESLNLYSRFSANAHAPNHPKITRALAYNAALCGWLVAQRKTTPTTATC